MGVPLTITGTTPTGRDFGPFVAPNGSTYVVTTIEDTGASKWFARVYKASAPDQSYSAVGVSTTNEPQAANGKNTGLATAAVLVGTRIFVAYVPMVSTSGGNVKMAWFETTTDTWGSASPHVDISPGGTENITPTSFGVCLTENGDIGVGWQTQKGAADDVVGTMRIPAADLAGATPFASMSFAAFTTGTLGFGSIKVAGGTGSRFHVLAADASNLVLRLVTRAAGATIASQTLTYRIIQAFGAYDAGAVVKCAALAQGSASTTVYWLTFDSADTPSVTEATLGMTGYQSAAPPATMGRMDGLWWILYNDSASTAKIRSVNDTGSSLGATGAWRQQISSTNSPLQKFTILARPYYGMAAAVGSVLVYDHFDPAPADWPGWKRPTVTRLPPLRASTR